LLADLQAALLLDRCPLDGFYLAFETCQLGRGLVVTAHQERSRPEHNDSDTSYERIARSLLVLHT